MCITVFMWQAHPLYPFLLFFNRDEYHSRPTTALEWWDGGEILGGKDEVAGGTWLASSKIGKFAFLTNFREIHQSLELRAEESFLFVSCSKKNPMDFAVDFVKDVDQYNGFNLVLADIYSKSMVYITNRPEENKNFVTEVSPGIHVLTNGMLDSPWLKAERLGHNFKELLEKYGEGELPIKKMVDKLMLDTTKKDQNLLPKILSFETEYSLSSIFVEAELRLGRFGTRSISAVSVKSSGEVYFYERHLEKEMWKEQTVSYQIEK